MNIDNIIGIVILVAFYGSYFLKMLVQYKNGIKTDRMGKGSKPKKTFIIEVILKTITFSSGAIQFISIIFINDSLYLIRNNTVRYFGFIISTLGAIIFIISIITMSDSWRAGIDNTQKTQIINTGIYKYSRNPAFLGFDLFYIGIGLSFSYILNIIFMGLSVLMLHLQILEEEKYLPTVFGNDYLNYKNKTKRYFGKI